MQTSARYQAVLELIGEIFKDKQPADNILNAYFRSRRFIGSKDRRFITAEVWNIIRRRLRLEFEAQSNEARKILLVYLKNSDINEIFFKTEYGLSPLTDEEREMISNLPQLSYPANVEAECPQWLYDKIRDMSLLKSLNESATADFRINTADRNGLVRKMLSEGFDVTPAPFSPIGVRAVQRINLANCMCYQDGLIEPQDEASQLAAILCDVKPYHKIIDYCCGAGGKSLALAYLLQNKGKIYAHDVDFSRMDALEARMKRLQISNIEKIKTSQAGYDYDRFIIDAPCSGSGTWRRSPDAKFRLTPRRLRELVEIQAKILDNAAERVKSGGRIIYITCSILEEENRLQIARFCKSHLDFDLVDIKNIWDKLIKTEFPFADKNCLAFNPLTTGTDGFFTAILQKK
ncbi:MAG: hypothetical protein IJ689_04675 [Alphaproteobacteria bacterium]|nr:hypothetical protein [Alphaproteobacteria bacterium]